MLSISLVLLLAAAGARAMPDYCKISTCGQVQEEHTMCMFNTSGASPDCNPVHERTVTPADQKEILALHNRLRAAVKKGEYASQGLPAAKDMPPLTWDPELATVAQRWADQCVDEMNDYCRDVPRFAVGQNIAYTYGEKNWTVAIDYCFFNEQLEYFNQTSLTYVAPSQDAIDDMTDTRKLSQLLWADTNTVGCGYIAVKYTLDSTPYYDDDSDYVMHKDDAMPDDAMPDDAMPDDAMPDDAMPMEKEEEGDGDEASYDESDSEAYLHTYICNYGPAGNIPGKMIYIKA